jgi:hypothetical protein
VKCLAEIEAGSKQAYSELLFLAQLIELVQLAGGTERQTYIPRAFGFTDIYRCPTCGTDDFIRVNKASQSLIEDIAALRILSWCSPRWPHSGGYHGGFRDCQ